MTDTQLKPILVLGSALGRPPRDFADYARETSASGVWNLEQSAS